MSDQTPPPVTQATLSEDIRRLIEGSTVLTEAEKKYWTDLLPTMKEDQLQQLQTILITEQQKMQDIDQKYDKKLEDVAQKYLNRWDSEKSRAARTARQQEEQQHREEEHSRAEDLLKNF
ncbi:MAG: hypothetical protein AB7J40_03420 [Candidatus Altimarinota bacterium]